MDEDQKKENPTPNGEEKSDPEVPIDFTTFILSLSSSAAYHLGLAPHPEQKDCCTNLPMARQTIDILSVLQDKTKGNLTGEEERLMSEILYNLRLAFVETTQKCGCSESAP